MLLSPTMLLSSPPTVPVNVGLFIGAFSAKLFVTSEAFEEYDKKERAPERIERVAASVEVEVE